MEEWTEMLENGDAIDVLYTDFSKAFDSVPHKRLLKKMKDLGITGNILAWVEAFLSNRKQQVRVKTVHSTWRNVISGIPQGSVLGPTLFVIFINDMPGAIKSLCHLFADDAKVYCNVHLREDENSNQLQSDIDKLVEWSRLWQLPFNTKKCKILHIGRENPLRKYKMNNQYLDQVYEEKDLGIIMDKDLSFHQQTASAVKKANRSLGIIKRSFANLDAPTLTLLYKALVRPHLEYGNVVWGPHSKQDIIAVEKVQRRATKLVQPLSNLTYECRLRALDLPSLLYRRRRGDMIFTYKLFHDEVDMNKDNFFSHPSRETRGHQQKIQKTQATKLCRVNVYSNRVVNDWNSLPPAVIQANTVNSFKNKLDNYWKNERFITPN